MYSPFERAPLEESKILDINYDDRGSGKFVMHGAIPDCVLRESGPLLTVGDADDIAFDPDASELEDHILGLQEARRLFQELEEVFGISNVGFSPFVSECGFAGGGVTSFIVSRKIDSGICLEILLEEGLPSNLYPAAENLLSGLSNYWKHKVKNNEKLLADIYKPDGYVYDPSLHKFVLVDMDPWIMHETYNIGRPPFQLQKLAKAVLNEEEYQDWLAEMATLEKEYLADYPPIV